MKSVKRAHDSSEGGHTGVAGLCVAMQKSSYRGMLMANRCYVSSVVLFSIRFTLARGWKSR